MIKGEKWKRRALVFIAFFATPVMAFASLAMFTSAEQPTQQDGSQSLIFNNSEAKAFAFSQARSWLKDEPSPLPGGEILSWNGFSETRNTNSSTSSSEKKYRFETHLFTVVRLEKLFEMSVQVALDEALGKHLVSTPSLSPIVNSSVTFNQSPWFDRSSTVVTSEVKRAVESWVSAFTSGDSTELRRVVQDKDPAHSYIPLLEVEKVEDIQTPYAASVTKKGHEPDPTRMLAHVRFVILWNGEPRTKTLPQPVSYDLLVHDVNTATPIVVAWGPSGSAVNLHAHQNAVTGVDLQTMDRILETGTPGE